MQDELYNPQTDSGTAPQTERETGPEAAAPAEDAPTAPASQPVAQPAQAPQQAVPAGSEKPTRGARAREESGFPFSVTVGKVYDGPLDLLLDLIRKQDIDIYDIPIAKITAQFLAYVAHIKA